MALHPPPLGGHADVVEVGGEEQQGQFVDGDAVEGGGGHHLHHAFGDAEGVVGVVEGEVGGGGVAFGQHPLDVGHHRFELGLYRRFRR